MVAIDRGPQKPRHMGGYSAVHTTICQQTLLTLIANLGPWRDGIYVIGGMVPLYLLDLIDNPMDEYIPTMDVDLVLDLEFLANVEAYSRLETNLKKMDFQRDENNRGNLVHYRWVKRVDATTAVVVDLLCDSQAKAGSAVSVEKGLSALAIPGAHLVIRDNVSIKISGELLDDGGVSTETIKVAGVVAFVILKAFAYDERREEKDAHDLVFILTRYPGGPDAVGDLFAAKLRDWNDEPMAEEALNLLRTHFGSEEGTEGHLKNGCYSYARFHISPGLLGQEVRLRRDAAAVTDRFLTRVYSFASSDA